MNVLLLGYYGHKNFGDDLLLELTANAIRNCSQVKSIGVTCTPDGEDYISKLVPFVDRIETNPQRRSFIKNYDRVIFGGGGTVFEYRKNLSWLYKAKKRITDYLDFGYAKHFGTQYASIGLGIGPFLDDRGKSISMNRLKYHSHVFVRDPVSYDLAATSGIDGLQLSHDLSFLDFKRVSDCAERRSDSDKNANTYCFIIRNYKYGSNGNACLEPMLEFADQLIAEQNAVVNWVSFQEITTRRPLTKFRKQAIQYGRGILKQCPLKMPIRSSLMPRAW